MPKTYRFTTKGMLSYEDLPVDGVEDGFMKVFFSPSAFAKMAVLVNRQTTEVAWHGLVSEVAPRVYLIEDVLVYPQIVSESTVDTDQIAYQNWLMLLDSESFDKARMQGHSHVNMSVSPSLRDIKHQSKIVNMLEESMYYIFMIWNKSFKYHIRVYDGTEKRLYYGKEVLVDLLSSESQPMDFAFNRENVSRFISTTSRQIESFYNESAGFIKNHTGSSNHEWKGWRQINGFN